MPSHAHLSHFIRLTQSLPTLAIHPNPHPYPSPNPSQAKYIYIGIRKSDQTKPNPLESRTLLAMDRQDSDKHIFTHTGVKPYECDHCGEDFYYRSNLISHLRIHSRPNKKPYKCDWCGQCFDLHTNLTGHMLRNHMFRSTVERFVVYAARSAYD